jgi:hypothetical protein
VLGGWVAFDPFPTCTRAHGRAVAALGGLRRGTVELLQDGIVNVAAEGTFNGLKVGPMAVVSQFEIL